MSRNTLNQFAVDSLILSAIVVVTMLLMSVRLHNRMIERDRGLLFIRRSSPIPWQPDLLASSSATASSMALLAACLLIRSTASTKSDWRYLPVESPIPTFA